MALLRFGFKSALAAGTIYYTMEEGVWKSSDDTAALYVKIHTTLSPLVSEVTKEVPIEMPELPKTEEICYYVQNGWNKGVIYSTMFMYNLPGQVVQWTKCGWAMARKQLEQVQQQSPQEVKENKA